MAHLVVKRLGTESGMTAIVHGKFYVAFHYVSVMVLLTLLGLIKLGSTLHMELPHRTL
jgi:hypothetical protein